MCLSVSCLTFLLVLEWRGVTHLKAEAWEDSLRGLDSWGWMVSCSTLQRSHHPAPMIQIINSSALMPLSTHLLSFFPSSFLSSSGEGHLTLKSKNSLSFRLQEKASSAPTSTKFRQCATNVCMHLGGPLAPELESVLLSANNSPVGHKAFFLLFQIPASLSWGGRSVSAIPPLESWACLSTLWLPSLRTIAFHW
jgi:hypothetical protein